MVCSVGVFLIIKQNMVFTTLAVIESVQEDQVHPGGGENLDVGSDTERAVEAVWTCLRTCGGLSIFISILMIAILYVSLAQLVKESNLMARMLPGLLKIRRRLQEEAAMVGLDKSEDSSKESKEAMENNQEVEEGTYYPGYTEIPLPTETPLQPETPVQQETNQA